MSYIAIDFETDLFGPYNMAPEPVCMSYTTPKGCALAVGDAMGAKLHAQIAYKKVVGQNISYDCGVAARAWPEDIPLLFQAYDEDRIFDTKIREKLLSIARGTYSLDRKKKGFFSLEGLARRYLDVGLNKEDSPRLDYSRLKGVPLEEWPEAHIKYAKDDAYYTLKIFEEQEKFAQSFFVNDVEITDVFADQHRQVRADFALHLMSCWGLNTDQERVARLKAATEESMFAIEEELLSMGLLKRNKKGVISRSKKKAQELMLEAMGDAAPRTDKGNIRAGKEQCQDSGDESLIKYAEYQTLQSFLGGHVKVLQEGIVHTRFDGLLNTGRTSSSKQEDGSGGNVQNVRSEVGARECFVPREGWVFVDCDYSQAELHTLAQTIKDCGIELSNLRDALNERRDPHQELGDRIRSYCTDDIPFRSAAKGGNFGLPGGMGVKGFQAYLKTQWSLELPLETCRLVVKAHKEQWPDIQAFLSMVKAQQHAVHGTVTDQLYRSKRWRGDMFFTAACNYQFQGPAGDGMKNAAWELAKACYLPGHDEILYGCRPVNEVHDQFLVEIPEDDYMHERAFRIRDIMVEKFNEYVPDVPVRAEPVLADCWSKNAEQVWDGERLGLWRYENPRN